MTSTTDVREWARQQGHQVGDRGSLPRALVEEYEAAHRSAGPVVPGEVVASDYADERDYPDVTGDADVTTAADVSDSSQPRQEKPRDSGERPPRKVQAPRRRQRRGGSWWRKLFGGGGGKKRSSGPRVGLGDFAEETWVDLAWLAEPLPPLSKILQVQAPYAGVVFDEYVNGTPIDEVLQPLARYSGVYRALNGLIGPPVFVLAICATGRYLEDRSGRIVADPQTGRPVPDPRTRMLFQALRYSLLQMAKVSDVSADEIAERTEGMAGRIAVIDKIVEDLFSFPQASPPAPASGNSTPGGGPAAPPAGTGQGENTYSYPPPPSMDGTGADLRR